MFYNYLMVAIRSLMKHKLYSGINIVGLAIGLASCTLILLYVFSELSYDKWIPEVERIYRVQAQFDLPGREPAKTAKMPGPTKGALEREFPQIQAAVRLWYTYPAILREGEATQDSVTFADETFFDAFELPMALGSRESALSDTSSIVLTESSAARYFGDRNPIGSVLTVDFQGTKKDMRVTGVLKDLPENTHLDLNMLALFDPTEYQDRPPHADNWGAVSMFGYIKLEPGADAAAIEAQFPAFEEEYVPDVSRGNQILRMADVMTLSLINVPDIHLHAEGLGDIKARGSATTVYVFSVIALVVLAMACINFVNLATARSSIRAREIALRKVVGAKRRQLVLQFVGESILFGVIAMVLAMSIVELSLPAYNNVLDTPLALSYLGPDGIGPYMVLLVVIVGALAGLYPAVYLSSFRPVRVLRANKSSEIQGSARLRNVLVVIQFAVSIGLMICTTVVYKQTSWAKSQSPGFNPEGLFQVSGLDKDAVAPISDVLVREMSQIPGVASVTRGSVRVAMVRERNVAVEIPGRRDTSPVVLGNESVDYDYFETFRIPVVKGRSFSESHGKDDATNIEASDSGADRFNVILNESAVRRLDLNGSEPVVGRQLRLIQPLQLPRSFEATVVGVVADTQFRSVRDEVKPIVYLRHEGFFSELTLRYSGVSESTVSAAADRTWRRHASGVPFDGSFVDDSLAAQYDAEDAQAVMLASFSGLAMVIACLGLYGLVSFSTQARTKEIGLRKVMGARVRNVVSLLLWQSSMPVLVANVVAWPAAWYIMYEWLNGYSDRIELSIVYFVVAGGGALLIAWATVSAHALRVARANPIHALRYE